MKKHLLLVMLATFAGISSQFWHESAFAQMQNAKQESIDDECMCIASAVVQTFCTREKTAQAKSEIRIAQERIAKRDIQERLNASIEADEAKDELAAAYNFTKDSTIKDLNGRIWTQQETEGQKGAAGQHYAGIIKVSDKTRHIIECLTLKGNEAIIYTNQHFVRYVPDRKDGSPHELITNIIHREIWVFTDDGWKNKHIEELQRGKTFLNGQPFDVK
jgi:hypothetical protein